MARHQQGLWSPPAETSKENYPPRKGHAARLPCAACMCRRVRSGAAAAQTAATPAPSAAAAGAGGQVGRQGQGLSAHVEHSWQAQRRSAAEGRARENRAHDHRACGPLALRGVPIVLLLLLSPFTARLPSLPTLRLKSRMWASSCAHHPNMRLLLLFLLTTNSPAPPPTPSPHTP